MYCTTLTDNKARNHILHVLCKDLRLEGDFNFDTLARLTPGYVGADLKSLINEAGLIAVSMVWYGMVDNVAHATLLNL